MRKEPSFGPNLKAHRLRYGWSAKHRSFIRITETRSGFVVEVAPADNIPNWAATRKNEMHFCWWDEPEILEMVRPLRMLRRCKQPFHFVVDEDGNLK